MSEETKSKVAITELTCTIGEFIECVDRTLDNTEAVTLCVSGPAGSGKTSIIEQRAKQRNMRVVVMRCSMMDALDINGNPVIVGTGEDTTTVYAKPQRLPGWDEKCLIFFDELNRGKEETQQAVFRVIEGRGTDSWKFNPANHRIIVAINPSNVDYHNSAMDKALVNRFLKISVLPDIKSFMRYGYDNNLDERILQFLSHSNGSLHVEGLDVEGDTPWASPRSWEKLSHFIKGGKFSSDNILYLAAAGAVGSEVGAAFIAFLADPDRPVRAVDIIEDFSDDLKKKFKVHQEKRIDKALATIMDLTALMNSKFEKKFIPQLKAFYACVSNEEIKTSFLKGLDQGDATKWDDIIIGLGISDEAITMAREVSGLKTRKKSK